MTSLRCSVALSLVMFGLLVGFGHAQNPIVPPGTYVADPSAHVWGDGRLYVYVSRDESPEYYCSWEHPVLSTANLVDWEIAPRVFASRGEGDRVPYSDSLLFAPDCQYRDGTYYFYYCLATRPDTAGVATSSSPTGPFGEGRVVDLDGVDEIDPAVFVDDDGQAYYLWGQFSLKMAKLKPNLLEIDPETIRDVVLTEEEHHFHEGGFLVKRGELYYLVYSHFGRGELPTCIGYATATSPMGPYRYRGVIIDNDHCDPGNWNNHGSLVEHGGQWCVFYHRSTHGCKTMRKVCVEPITFNPDGSIDEVEMTSQGAGEPLDARGTIEAERACLLYGGARIQAFAPTEEELGRISDGDRAAFKYVDFGIGVDRVTMRVMPGEAPVRIDVALDRSWARTIASVEVPAKEGKREGGWVELGGALGGVSGVHAVWLRFRGGKGNLRLDWLRFDGGEEQEE